MKTKSSQQKRLEGTYQPCRDRGTTPEPSTDKPKPLDWLNDAQNEVFEELCDRLAEIGQCSATYEILISMAAVQVEQVMVLSRVLKNKGRTYQANGLTKSRPEVAMLSQAIRQSKSLLHELGLSPSTIGQLKITKPTEPNEWDDF